MDRRDLSERERERGDGGRGWMGWIDHKGWTFSSASNELHSGRLGVMTDAFWLPGELMKACQPAKPAQVVRLCVCVCVCVGDWGDPPLIIVDSVPATKEQERKSERKMEKKRPLSPLRNEEKNNSRHYGPLRKEGVFRKKRKIWQKKKRRRRRRRRRKFE